MVSGTQFDTPQKLQDVHIKKNQTNYLNSSDLNSVADPHSRVTPGEHHLLKKKCSSATMKVNSLKV